MARGHQSSLVTLTAGQKATEPGGTAALSLTEAQSGVRKRRRFTASTSGRSFLAPIRVVVRTNGLRPQEEAVCRDESIHALVRSSAKPGEACGRINAIRKTTITHPWAAQKENYRELPLSNRRTGLNG